MKTISSKLSPDFHILSTSPHKMHDKTHVTLFSCIIYKIGHSKCDGSMWHVMAACGVMVTCGGEVAAQASAEVAGRMIVP